MGWISYPTALNGYGYGYGAGGQSGQAQNPTGLQNGVGSPQNLQAIATSTAPYSSGLVTGLKALAGYMGGQAQGDQGAAPASASSDPSPSLLGALLRGGSTSADPSTADPTTGQAPASGWGAVGQNVGQAAQAIGRKSDRRLKSDVTRIGTLPNGLAVYRYRLQGGPFEVGCMADEVLSLHPGAVWEAEDGFLRVDYSMAVL